MIDVSDIIFQVDSPVKIKKNGLVFPITRSELTSNTLVRCIGIIYGARDGDDSAYQRVMSGEDSNTTYTYKTGVAGKLKKEIRYRVNCLRDGDIDVTVSMRLNKSQISTLSEIGQSSDGELYQNMFPVKGITLITGSVDSGKTTLIYACLNEFILRHKRHAFIDTYENPIEGNLRDVVKKNNIQNKSVRQCPVPLGVKTYTSAIHQSLRRNTDIILLGEIRTQEEVIGLINGALATGKHLMGTLHTDSIPVTFSRLYNTLSSSNEGQMRSLIYDLIKNFNMIVSQKLLHTIDLKRIAVYETLIFTKSIKERLLSVPMEQLTSEIVLIMKESNDTMVHKAKKLFDNNVISSEEYYEFEAGFSY